MGKLTISGWWFGTFFISHILGMIIPMDFHIFQRDWNHQPDFNGHVQYQTVTHDQRHPSWILATVAWDNDHMFGWFIDDVHWFPRLKTSIYMGLPYGFPVDSHGWHISYRYDEVEGLQGPGGDGGESSWSWALKARSERIIVDYSGL